VSRLVVALDTPDTERLRSLAAAVGPHVSHLKVGLEAFAALGPAAVEAVRGVPVFLDLKLHDIPNTVRGAAGAVSRLGVDLLTVHASGGPEMIEAAVRAAPDTRILAVTVLTSLDEEALAAVGQPPVDEQVPRLARLAVEAGAAGIVCAPTDVAAVRQAVGASPLLVTPGIRPSGGELGDQARVSTPAAAVEAGADLLVVGRPVTEAADAAAAARRIAEEAEA
jgi:orotidine-5'-phosphate decarboxylase